MAAGSYLSIITLNVNRLNAPAKRQRPLYMLSTGDPPQNLFLIIDNHPEKKKKRQAVLFIALLKDNGRQTIFSSNSGVLAPSVSPPGL